MIRKQFILLLILFQPVFLFAVNVNIKGKADAMYWNKTVKAYVYDDLISRKIKPVSKAEIDSKGNYSVNIELLTTTYVMLRIDNKQATLYCEPGNNYEARILAPDTEMVETVGNFIPIDLAFSISDSLELNYLIYNYDQLYNSFLAKKKGWTMKDGIEFERRIDTFTVRVKKKFANAKNRYFQDYITYTCATMQMTFKKPEFLFNTYIKGKPIQYEHFEYMSFLDAWFALALGTANASSELKKQVNDIESLDGLYKCFAKMEFAQNDTLKEIGVAKCLAMCFNDIAYKKDNLSGLLKACVNDYKVKEDRVIAKNLDHKFGRFLPGSTVPKLTGTDTKGNKVDLESLKGKYVYLAFFRSDCKVCEEQFRLIYDYKRKYGTRIEFVYVSIDKDIKEMNAFMQKYPKASWIVINNSDDEMKDDYNVVAIPTYYFISPQGTFLEAPAREPGLDMEKVFDGILKKKDH